MHKRNDLFISLFSLFFSLPSISCVFLRCCAIPIALFSLLPDASMPGEMEGYATTLFCSKERAPIPTRWEYLTNVMALPTRLDHSLSNTSSLFYESLFETNKGLLL